MIRREDKKILKKYLTKLTPFDIINLSKEREEEIKMAKKKFIMVLDTETANGMMINGKLDLSYSLVYDIGFTVIDKKGNIYCQGSLAIRDVFCGMRDVMKSAYYAKKIPKYWEDIKAGKRDLVSFMWARKIILDTMKEYGITTVAAHNASFDIRALNNTIRYITKSEKRYFFPYGTEIWDTLKGATNTICKQKGYIAFCEKNKYLTAHKIPKARATAEILYKYISGNYDFIEEHQGLSDTEIEARILVQILKQHSKKEYIRLYA